MTALVVGAGPGMGRAIAKALGRAHGPVALIARRKNRLQDLVAQLGADSIAAAGFTADIANRSALIAAIDAARQELGPPGVVVFNASVFVAGTPAVVPPEAFARGMATGITAALITLQSCVADLRRAAPASALLFTGSGLALNPWPPGIGLAIQKAGLRHLALAAAQELTPEAIHVAIVTIRGDIAEGGAFDPDRIARVYADLATPGIERPVEVMFTADGPDWVRPVG